jgi:hypothetical protein
MYILRRFSLHGVISREAMVCMELEVLIVMTVNTVFIVDVT